MKDIIEFAQAVTHKTKSFVGKNEIFYTMALDLSKCLCFRSGRVFMSSVQGTGHGIITGTAKSSTAHANPPVLSQNLFRLIYCNELSRLFIQNIGKSQPQRRRIERVRKIRLSGRAFCRMQDLKIPVADITASIIQGRPFRITFPKQLYGTKYLVRKPDIVLIAESIIIRIRHSG